MSAIDEAIRTAEDGLDPADALTPNEALARILWVLRSETSVADGYNAEVGITDLSAWMFCERNALGAYRKHLEQHGLVASWVSA